MIYRWLSVAAIVALSGALFASYAAAADKPLKVCADPDYMPFSNQAGEGFENKVAELIGHAMNRPVEYTWHSYRGQGGFEQFLSETLDAGHCDVVMDTPFGDIEELTTEPYYESAYVFVYKKNNRYDLSSMDSEVLRQVKVGFERDTPPETGLQMRGLVVAATPFDVGGDPDTSPASVLDAVKQGKVNVMITWEPAIGYFMKNYPGLTMDRVPNERALGSPERYAFSMAMAVRKGDTKLQQQLNKVIKTHQSQIQAILNQYNVKMPAPQDNGIQSY